MNVPLQLPDKPGRGTLWANVRALTDDYINATNRGDTHEAGRLEQRLSRARAQFHSMYGVKIPPVDR